MIEIPFVSLYFIFSLLLLPYGYNLFYLLYMSRRYKWSNPDPVKNHKHVTVQLPVYNEKFVAERLIDYVSRLQWPRDKLQILVLDDSTDETREIIDEAVSKRRAEGFDIEALRRDTRTGYKAGALENALKHTKGDYIAIIDADFMPPMDFLEKTVAAIESDPEVGFIQARWSHVNRAYNWLTKAFALAIDGYHIVEQSARSAAGIIFNFNGSAGLLRVEAIKDAGGWSWDTLSEDMDLSYRIQLAGWKSIYLRDLTVPGEIPTQMSAFRTQQGRWARGSVQCAKKLIPKVWLSARPLFQKIEATLHLSYYTISLWMFLSLLVAVPILVLNAFPYINNPVFMGLFSLAGVSSFTLYLTAIRHQKMSLMRELPHIAMLALIGYGISAKVSVEMIKGLLYKGGEWIRVPKLNLIHPGQRIENAYATFKEVPWLELGMLVYTAIGIFFAFFNQSYGILLYLMVYFLGYFIIVAELFPIG
jgi:cellulose synthase/poly-beta-1,6-N-acetylglucosamine synthase-like glycosyltransferase